MTHHDNVDRDLPSWLAEEAASSVPVGLLDAVTAASRSRRQQPAWLVTLRGESMGAISFASAAALRIAIIFVLVAVAILAAALAAGMPPPQPKSGSPLAFIRDGDVYLAAEDGSNAHLVLHQGGVAFRTVAWSPGGTRLVLYGDPGVVVVFDITNGLATVVDGDNHSPVWSPQGDALAVLSGVLDTMPPQALRVLDSESLANRAIHPFLAIGGLAWSPNGRWIAGTGGGERVNAVLRIDVATGEVVQVGPSSGHLDSDKQVSWAPDSRSIAFIRYFNAEPGPACSDDLACSVDIFVANADGSNPIRVNAEQGHADMPRWSPDGTWLAFRKADFSQGDFAEGLAVVRPDGSGERTVTTEPVATYAWSPASDRFVFVRSYGFGQPALWEAPLTGEARSLGVPIDNAWTFRGTGFSFDLQPIGP